MKPGRPGGRFSIARRQAYGKRLCRWLLHGMFETALVEAIALALERDDFGEREEAIQNRRRRRYIAEKHAPILCRSV